MSVQLEEQTNIIPGFDEACLARILESGVEPDLLRAKRDQAFASYSAQETPTARTEEWRRTDPAWFDFAAMTPAAPLPLLDESAEGPWDEHFDVVVSISDAGLHVRDRSGVLRDGTISVLPLAEAAEKLAGLVEEHHLGRVLPPEQSKFSALNAAFCNAGLAIHIPKGVELPKGVLIRSRFETADTVQVPRLLIVAEADSKAVVVEHQESPDGLPLLVVGAREMVVGENALLQVCTLKEWGDATCQIGNEIARVERQGTIDLITLNFGGKVNKLMFGSDVAGEGSSAELDGVFFADGSQHIDQKTWQIHSSPDTYSRLLYKGAVRDTGRSVYQGVIQAKPGAIRVDAYQTNNNIILNDGARVDTIPGLLIDADDLKCSHGATIGSPDENQIFYLRSRGLSEKEARNLVIIGFFDEVLERIPFDFLRDRARKIISQKYKG